MTYHFDKGTTNIHKFWGDMHLLSFRSDKVINEWAEMQEVVKRFEADPTQFDVIDYSGHPKTTKAAREYTVFIERVKIFTVYEFEYQGKEYKTKTTKWSVGRDIRKNANVIREYEQEVLCLIDDATGKIISEIKTVRYLPSCLDDFSQDDFIHELNSKLKA